MRAIRFFAVITSLLIINCSFQTGGVDEIGNFFSGYVYKDGSPVVNEKVSLISSIITAQGDSFIAVQTQLTDNFGRYFFQNIPDGKYTIYSSATNSPRVTGFYPWAFASRNQMVQPDTIHLKREITIMGRVIVRGPGIPSGEGVGGNRNMATNFVVFIPGIGREGEIDSISGVYTVKNVPIGNFDIGFIINDVLHLVPVEIFDNGADTTYIRDIMVVDLSHIADNIPEHVHNHRLAASVSVRPIDYGESESPQWYEGKDFSNVVYGIRRGWGED